jgi:hypothetical protein
MTALRTGVIALAVAAGTVNADYSTGFEAPDYSGSAAGVPLTNGFGGGGQQGWYNPVSGSRDFNVHEYGGNALGFVNNPNGERQFVGVGGIAAPGNIGRAQHNHDFSAGGVWTVDWDVNGMYVGTSGVPVNNLGSFSLQPSASANYFQQLMAFPTGGTGTTYDINYGSFGAAGGGAIAFLNAGAAWQGIPTNHWIHQSTTWDFTTNKILSVSIQDITAGGPMTTMDVSGLGWYLFGGQNNVLGTPLPTDIRLFTGNTDNVTGWDNVNVRAVPAPGALALLGLGAMGIGRRRR